MKLVALQPIRYDGKRYAVGDLMEIADKAKQQALALITCGSAEPAEKAKARTAADAKRHAQALSDAQDAIAAAEEAFAKASDEEKPAAQAALDAANAAFADLEA
ncbi:hypothetical protein [Hydrogenophaga sp. ANAO-22]|uniref:DUF7210 family protein n=1 Tax=Hydrogenophaga sp. ANAO-22 TaxID=3166645 RepID=UPI0036D3F22B